MSINKPFIIKKEEEPLKRFKNILTEQTVNNGLKKSLDEAFTLIGEEFKSIKNCELYKFFTNLSEKEQKKIINFLKNIINNESKS